MAVFIGIDPGLRSGAWGAVDHHGGYIDCGDVPTDGDRIDANAFRAELLRVIDPRDVADICIESVGVRPGQGAVSTGRFMRAAGAIEAVCAIVSAPVSYARPQDWKKHFGLSANKTGAVVLAKRLMPECSEKIKLARHHNRAEALLIAQYWRSEVAGIAPYEAELGGC